MRIDIYCPKCYNMINHKFGSEEGVIDQFSVPYKIKKDLIKEKVLCNKCNKVFKIRPITMHVTLK